MHGYNYNTYPVMEMCLATVAQRTNAGRRVLGAMPVEEAGDGGVLTGVSIGDEQLPTNFRKTLLRRIQRERGCLGTKVDGTQRAGRTRPQHLPG